MKIFDAHCDVLYKMWVDPSINFYNSNKLHTNYLYIKKNALKSIQCFAIYIPPRIHESLRFQAALEMINIFYEKILTFPDIRLITTKNDAINLQDNEVGAILTLEGCEAIGSDLIRLKTLFRLGVRSVGLTWNDANAAADGILEERGAGLTSFGKKVVKLNNQCHVWTDVSHLSEKAFWDVIELSDYPIASHSNAKTITNHPRNLTDAQILSLIKKNGAIGITFVPEFLTESGEATIGDILKHIDHICSLGGYRHIGFGSDFDGIDTTPAELTNYSKYPLLINELLKRYPEHIVKGFLYNHFLNRIPF